MKVQWQLVDIETKETIATLGEPFVFMPSVFKEALDALNKGPRDTPDCYDEKDR